MSQTNEASSRGLRAPPFPLVLVALLLAGLGLGRLLSSGSDARALSADLADPAKRTIAYGKLLDLREAAVPALLEVVGQTASPGRGEAIELLGRIGDARALPAILAVDDPSLADERLVALGKLQGDEALAEVLEALRGPDVALKFPALRALADWRDVETARLLPEVEPYLAHELSGLREFAAKFMGARRHAPAVPALVGLLRDDDGAVRQMAAWALSQIGTQDAVAAVDSAVKSGAVAVEAAEGL